MAQLTDVDIHVVTLQIGVGKVSNTQPVVEACENPEISLGEGRIPVFLGQLSLTSRG